MLAALLALTLAAAGPRPDSDPLRLVPADSLVAREGALALGEPAGVAVDVLGQAWASDAAGHRIVRWDAAGRWLDETGALGSGANQFRRPMAVARLGSLGVAVLDVENRRIVAYDLRGRLTDLSVTLDDPALEARVGRVTPVGLAADRGGALYVADAERDRILAFDFSGRFLHTIGGVGLSPGAFHGLAAIAVAPRGELVTLERAVPPARRRGTPAEPAARGTPGRVQWLDASGGARAAWTLPGPAGAEVAIAVDDSGRVAIARGAGRSGEVCVYDRDGTPLARLSGLASPRALAFGPDGALLVAEAGAARVRRFTLAPAAGE